MTNAGGCCTDMHSMFIAMARARGIPARLQMGMRRKDWGDKSAQLSRTVCYTQVAPAAEPVKVAAY